MSFENVPVVDTKGPIMQGLQALGQATVDALAKGPQFAASALGAIMGMIGGEGLGEAVASIGRSTPMDANHRSSGPDVTPAATPVIAQSQSVAPTVSISAALSENALMAVNQMRANPEQTYTPVGQHDHNNITAPTGLPSQGISRGASMSMV